MPRPTKVSKKASATQPEVVEVPEVVVPEVVEEVVPDVGSRLEKLKAVLHDLEKSLSENVKAFKAIDHEIKNISSLYRKERKRKQSKPRSPGSSNHGFNALVSISKELASFLEVSPDTKFRRPEVTILISEYAKKAGLKNPENKGIYLPDAKLATLFGPAIYKLRSDKENFGYDMFNLQKYMKPHFDKQ